MRLGDTLVSVNGETKDPRRMIDLCRAAGNREPLRLTLMPAGSQGSGVPVARLENYTGLGCCVTSAKDTIGCLCGRSNQPIQQVHAASPIRNAHPGLRPPLA